MKSYFASSIQKAIADAKRELGSDAILVSTRISSPDGRSPAQYEVLFSTDSSVPSKADTEVSRRSYDGPAISSASTNPLPSMAGNQSGLDGILNEIKELRRQIESMRSNREGAVIPRTTLDGDTQKIFSDLVRADVDPDLAQQLIAAALRDSNLSESPASFSNALKLASGHLDFGGRLRRALGEEIRKVFLVDSAVSIQLGTPASLALIGPPGAGKTSTIAKLAIRLGLKLRRPTLLVSLEGNRVGASEQLRAYATLLGFRLEVARSVQELQQICHDNSGNGLTLIDTPGFTAAELEHHDATAAFFAGHGEIQKHLVLPATSRAVDLAAISRAYEIFRPSHLLFTRADEARVFGPLLNEAMSTQRPVSFFCFGQNVPEDITTASADFLIERIPAVQNQPGMAMAA